MGLLTDRLGIASGMVRYGVDDGAVKVSFLGGGRGGVSPVCGAFTLPPGRWLPWGAPAASLFGRA